MTFSYITLEENWEGKRLKLRELQAIYVMWARQMKRFVRAKSRVIGNIVQPIFFLAFLGMGLNKVVALPGSENLTYLDFLAPGIISMSIMFSSAFAGISIIWDRRFGFLQEVLVAPVSRLSIVIGRALGGGTVALIQGFIILIISILLGVKVKAILPAIPFMILSALVAVGFGIMIATFTKDFQGFQLIMNLLLFPMILLSSAFFPIDTMPCWLKVLSEINPLTYVVDGLRGSLMGYNHFPLHVDFLIVFGVCMGVMFLSSYLFNRSEI